MTTNSNYFIFNFSNERILEGLYATVIKNELLIHLKAQMFLTYNDFFNTQKETKSTYSVILFI